MQSPLNILCLLRSKCCAGSKGGEKKKIGTKAQPRLKRLIIFQQKQVRMVRVTFVHTALCKSTQLLLQYKWGYKKKLWQIPQVSYHWERDQPKQAAQGWAFQPEALEVFTVFMWQSWGLDFHCASLRYSHGNTEKVKAGYTFVMSVISYQRDTVCVKRNFPKTDQ